MKNKEFTLGPRFAFLNTGEKVLPTIHERDLGHGKQIKVVYSDGSEGWEHIENFNCTDEV